MREVERVARVYRRYYAVTYLLLFKLLSFDLPTDAEMQEFKQLGDKVGRINKRYIKDE